MPEDINIPNNNLKIDQALKEFELKAQAEQISQIPQAPEASKTSDVPKMVQLVMKWFGFKEQKQAEYILLGFVIIAVIISLFLVFWGGKKTTSMPINIQNIDQSQFIQFNK